MPPTLSTLPRNMWLGHSCRTPLTWAEHNDDGRPILSRSLRKGGNNGRLQRGFTFCCRHFTTCIIRKDTHEIRSACPGPSRYHCLVSSPARTLPYLRRCPLRHQRALGLRHRQPQPLRDDSRGSGGHDRNCWLSGIGDSGFASSLRRDAGLRLGGPGFLTPPCPHRESCLGRLVRLLRDFAGDDFADYLASPHRNSRPNAAQTHRLNNPQSGALTAFSIMTPSTGGR